jgi:hypothetical protein
MVKTGNDRDGATDEQEQSSRMKMSTYYRKLKGN